jgi:transposase
MPAVAITREDYDAAGLRALAGQKKDAKVVRRLLALAAVLDGAPREAAARLAGMDRQTLRDWVHRYNAGGPNALANRKAPGQPPSLDTDQMAQLAEWVRAGPDPQSDGVVRWRRQDLAARIQREFGVQLAERSVGAILQRLNLKILSVRPRHPQQDAEAVAAHKKTSPSWSRARSRKPGAADRSSSGGRMRHGSASKAP